MPADFPPGTIVVATRSTSTGFTVYLLCEVWDAIVGGGAFGFFLSDAATLVLTVKVIDVSHATLAGLTGHLVPVTTCRSAWSSSPRLCSMRPAEFRSYAAVSRRGEPTGG